MLPSEVRTIIPMHHWAFSATKSPTPQKAASFKTQGVLAPLLVRELEPSKYEVVAGARRLRAARIAELDPQLPVSDVLSMQQIIEQSLGNASLCASLVLGFAVLSLLLASVGLYGVVSYLTTQRTPEIGVRMALGAERGQVLRLLLGEGLRPAFYGLTVGLVASIGAVRLIQSMLYGTRPLDPAIFASVSASLLIVGALACLVPAWRASRIEPMRALRNE